MAKAKPKEKKKGRILKFKTARGRTTRYSCLYSTVPDKGHFPPRV